MINDKGEALKNNTKKCPHCGSTSTIPIRYGLMTDEAHQENVKERKWVWGGCVIYEEMNTDHCTECNNGFGGDVVSEEKLQAESFDEESFLKRRKKLLNVIDEYLDEEKDGEMYAAALHEAEGDEVEADHIYFGLYMQSIDKYLFEEYDEKLYAKALSKASGDEKEAEKIYLRLCKS